jgi:hypothetical protein
MKEAAMFDDDDYGKRDPYDIPPGTWPEWWQAIQVILVLGVLVGVVALVVWAAWVALS